MPSAESGFPGDPDLLISSGPFVRVRIGFEPQYDPDDSDRLPGIPSYQYPALIDTGATECCIDATLARALDLPVVDRISIVGAHGPQDTDMYRAQIYVPGLRAMFDGRVAGLPLRSAGQPFFALLGRDFLRMFTMVYDGPTGSVTITRD